MWTAWIPSGFPPGPQDRGRILKWRETKKLLSRSYGQVFAIYMTKSKMIPKAGGQKYGWEQKVTFHLDLEDLAQWAVFLLDPAPSQPFLFYRKGIDQKEKSMTFLMGENRQYVVKTVCGKEEIVLTLLPADLFLLIQGLKSLIEEMFWYGHRN